MITLVNMVYIVVGIAVAFGLLFALWLLLWALIMGGTGAVSRRDAQPAGVQSPPSGDELAPR